MRVQIIHEDTDVDEIYTVVDIRKASDTYIFRILFLIGDKLCYGSIHVDRKYEDTIDLLFRDGYATFLADNVSINRYI